MIRKFRKYLKVVHIDILVYSMRVEDLAVLPDIGFAIDASAVNDSKTRYEITDNGLSVHRSFLFNRVHVLRLIGKKGPAVGDCVTIPEYKGRSIYPFVINYIAHELLEKQKLSEVFIIVNPDNAASIRGIEKAGFQLHARVKAKRFLLFYFNVSKQLFRNALG